MAVATTEHSVDALHPFFKAQPALSDRLRDKVRGFVSLAVGRQHWRSGVSLQHDVWGISPGLVPDHKSLSLLRTPLTGRYE